MPELPYRSDRQNHATPVPVLPRWPDVAQGKVKNDEKLSDR